MYLLQNCNKFSVMKLLEKSEIKNDNLCKDTQSYFPDGKTILPEFCMQICVFDFREKVDKINRKRVNDL